MKIAILQHPKISIAELRQYALPFMFLDAEIITLSPETLFDEGLSSYHMLVLGGILGEDSPYPEIFTPARALKLKQAIQNGLVLWAECAATYHLTESYSYTTSAGLYKKNVGLGFIAGTATGPAFPHHYNNGTYNNRLGRTCTVAHIFNAKADNLVNYHALDINGPALHPHPSLTNDPNVDILRYGNAYDQPVCGIVKKEGNGLIMAFSFHAAIPFSSAPHAQGMDVAADDNRLSFLNHQANLIHAHVRTLK